MDRRHVLGLGLGGLAATSEFLSSALLSTAMAQAVDRELALVKAARRQIGVTVSYDPAYQKLSYPAGDVPRETGVCTDVVIRAYRDAFNIDLQKLVHVDMVKNFSAYPKIWGLKKPDRNIDHRRVPNLMAFLKRQGAAREVTDDDKDYKPGDIVTMMLPGNLPHIALVSDAMAESTDRPLLIHNIGQGTRDEDILFRYSLTGHFRYALA
jgi:uncharacterized protein